MAIHLNFSKTLTFGPSEEDAWVQKCWADDTLTRLQTLLKFYEEEDGVVCEDNEGKPVPGPQNELEKAAMALCGDTLPLPAVVDEKMWFNSEEGHNLDVCVAFVQAYLKEFKPTGHFTLSWAETHSQPRQAGTFGGGAMFITATEIEGINTSDWLTDHTHNALLEEYKRLKVIIETYINFRQGYSINTQNCLHSRARAKANFERLDLRHLNDQCVGWFLEESDLEDRTKKMEFHACACLRYEHHGIAKDEAIKALKALGVTSDFGSLEELF